MTLISIENLNGAGLNDTLLGDGGVNILTGQGGNDILNGRGGADTLDGGAGIDTASYDDFTTALTITIGGYNSDGDTLISIENLIGGSANDVLTGDGIANRIEGRDGNDVINGAGGSDTLLGDAGDDVLSGGDGNDVLQGGAGADTLTGGIGADRFVYMDITDSGTAGGTRDRITDFNRAAGDLIDFSAIDVDPDTAGHQALTFLGTGVFTHTAGEMRVVGLGSGVSIIAVDLDGDANSDLVIDIDADVTDLTAAAFLL
jgi:Ca2+-binding RTX toxin-like protein